MPWYPKAILSIAGALALALYSVRPFREWAFRINLRWVVGFHLIRFVGVYFLYLYAQHELPYGFAVWGGFGDIIVAMLAIAVIYFASYKPAVIVWSIVGLVDILAVAATAARSEMAVPGSMHQLNKFPLILLPTFVVPMIIVTHGLVLVRVLEADA
jgi:hypothetical protein